MIKRPVALCLTGLAVIIAPSASASAAECYDLKLRAKPIEQMATPIPEIPGRIVMRWPWFVDLKVKAVLEGEYEQKRLFALAVMHGARIKKTYTYHLRENDLGGFNIVSFEDPEAAVKCSPDTQPMQAYLTPGDGETLDEYRRRITDPDQDEGKD